jgi:hypothetical protein
MVPKLAVSNVGCWRWEGTSSVRGMLGPGSSSDVSATGVAFERMRSPMLPAGISGTQEAFAVASGHVMAMSVSDIGGGTGECVVRSMASGAALAADGHLVINLDLDLGTQPGNRRVLAGSGSSTLPTTGAYMCAGMTIPIDGPMPWSWLEISNDVAMVSMDGRTLEGSFSDPPQGGASSTATWRFSAVREL